MLSLVNGAEDSKNTDFHSRNCLVRETQVTYNE